MTYLNTIYMDEKADGLEVIVIPVTVGISAANGTNKQLPVLYFPDNPRIMKKNILLINGPNLNLLGMREPETYGTQTLPDLEKMCLARSQELGMELTAFQTNHEGAIVDAIQQAKGTYTHIVINPGAYTHTSIAIRDAIIGVDAKVYEVHISDIHSREKFRHHSYISDIAQAVFAGQGLPGYIAAIDLIAKEA